MWPLACAFLSIGAQPADVACAPSDKAALNLTWRRLDQNWVPLDPWWNLQEGTAGGPLPDPASPCLCGGFPPKAGGIPSGSPECTQQTAADMPTGLHKFICGLEWFKDGRRNVARGHINWMPVTFHGRLSFGSKSGPDDDYNFELLPATKAPNSQTPAVTQWNQHGSTATIHVELKGEESFARLSHPWWREFSVAATSDAAKARQMIDRRPASVTGLFGLDAEHKGHSELHPAYVMAIQTRCDDQPDGSGWYDDEWAILARNAGNEGFCSSWKDLHFFDAPGRIFSVALPDGVAERRTVRIGSTSFSASVPGALGPEIVSASPADGGSAHVRFRWPSNLAQNMPIRIHGALMLRWKPERRTRRSCVSASALVAPLVRPPETEWDTESLLEALVLEGEGQQARLAPPPDAHPVQMGAIGPAPQPAGGLCPGRGPGGTATCADNVRAGIADRLVRRRDVAGAAALSVAEEEAQREEEALCAAAEEALKRLTAAPQGEEGQRTLQRVEALVSYCAAR